MSNLYKWCCCGDQGDPCAPACECDSSYIISAMSGQLSFEASTTNVAPCTTLCDQYDGGNIQTYVGLNITLFQGNTQPLARPVGKCCYQAYGEFNGTYNFNLTQRWYCCGIGQGTVCTHTENATGSITLPFCYTAYCDPLAYNNGPGWVHTLTICGFCHGNIQVVTSPPTLQECIDGISCDELPLARYGLCFGGATYEWRTPLKCLDIINRTTEVNPIGPCIQPGPCAVADGDGPCIPTAVQQSLLNGPFSPYVVAEFTGGNPKPEECDETSIGTFPGSTGPWTIALNCVSHKDLCTGGYDYTSDCCRAELSYGFNFPVIV